MTSNRRNDPAWQARADLAAALRWAVRYGLNEGVCNHFSLELPDGSGHYLINPQGRHWAEASASDMVVVDSAGRVVAGKHAVEPTAFYIHSRLHRAKPAARCILHTHMPYATALTLLQDGRLEPASQNALRFHRRIAYDEHYGGLALDEAEGDRMCAAMGNADILFLANHGVIVTGPDLAVAFDDLYYLERACMAQVLALSTGGMLRLVPEPIASLTARQTRQESQQAALHFQALRRILDRSEPDYAD